MQKYRVGILGATGAVGQRFVQLLSNHPWFELTALAASERSAGKSYAEATKWVLDEPMPEQVKGMAVSDVYSNLPCDALFSALDASVAGEIEERFAQAGYAVLSNSKNHRMDVDAPLLVPEVNPEHLEILELQKQRRGSSGFIITNPNCTTTGLVMALKPLHDNFKITKVIVTTMQALSGAGYPGVASMDILDNVIPYIGGEEEKVESEPRKILGGLSPSGFIPAEFRISAHCNRVAVRDGHTECVSAEFERKATIEEARRAFSEFVPSIFGLNLPSAPKHCLVLRQEDDRPQPRKDRNEGDGMSVVIGRLRPDNVLDYKFTLLVHNTIRGAAGGSILNAELLAAKGLLPRR
ncbi:aspartate-semialdehyde dehydrogenase [Candidatus Uhrbacteria bacterium]|nr:aspartate-semialdehyde dehydrogenase [Candidatus Uhrbacteria bacterium]